MSIHAPDSANWHSLLQVPIATLRKKSAIGLDAAMSSDFRDALIWHMEQHETPISDLVRETGVSRDVINKLRARPGSSTTAENAMLIAAYYGKSVNDFISRKPASEADRLAALFGLLSEEERRMLEAQLHGLLSQRGQK